MMVYVSHLRDGESLGRCYNDIMEACPDPWALILDHDVLVLSPKWHCRLEAMTRGCVNRVGWISAVTNRCFCQTQQSAFYGSMNAAPASDNIAEHIAYGAHMTAECGDALAPGLSRDAALRHPFADVFSGMFMLLNREAWRDVGGFPEHEGQFAARSTLGTEVQFQLTGLLGWDNAYCLRLRNHGYSTLVAPGIYCYHIREAKPEWSHKP